MKWAIPLLLVLLSAVAVAVPMVSVTVQTNPHTPVNVYVNGLNLNNKVNDLQNQLDELAKKLSSMKLTIADYIHLTKLENELEGYYFQAIANAIKQNKTGIALKLLQKLQLLRAKENLITANLIEKMCSNKPKHGSLGWFDIFGNHKSFTSTDYYINPKFDFRLLDCWSDIGQSVVLKGGTIMVKGYIYTAGTKYSKPIKVYLVDPEQGGSPRLLISTKIGENETTSDASISWISPTTFVVRVKAGTVGIKQLNFEFENYTVACQFVVLKPFIHEQKIGNAIRVVTNYPKLEVNGRIVTPVDGVVWIPENSTVVGLI